MARLPDRAGQALGVDALIPALLASAGLGIGSGPVPGGGKGDCRRVRWLSSVTVFVIILFIYPVEVFDGWPWCNHILFIQGRSSGF